MQIPHDSFVLVADGRKSLFFRNQGDAEFPNLAVEEKEVDINPAHHEQASDLAGRASNTLGSSMEEVDFHQLEEERFAARTAGMLNARALRNDYDSLVVVARSRSIDQEQPHLMSPSCLLWLHPQRFRLLRCRLASSRSAYSWLAPTRLLSADARHLS